MIGEESQPELAAVRQLLERVAEAVERLNGVGYGSLPFSLKQLLSVLLKHKGTFLHLNAGCPPMLRINQELVPIGDHVMSARECRYLVNSVLTPEQLRAQAQGHELDFNYVEEGTGFRFHVYLERGCPAASIRRLRTDIPKLMELGLSGSAVEKFLSSDHGGLMILSGKPRCGKINTFASLVSYINQQRRVRIVTIEPVIQFWHKNAESVVIQRELGSDTRSFAQAVRQAVQQDPDILAVGGIPDKETAEVIIQAAAGGHLVVALLDAVSSVRAVDEMLSAFYGSDGRIPQLLGRVLRIVVCQHLVPRADGRGLIPAIEIMECNDEIRQMVARGEVSNLHHVMREQGMQTLGRHLSRMTEVGTVTRDEALKLVDESELEVSESLEIELPVPQQPAGVDNETPLMSWL